MDAEFIIFSAACLAAAVVGIVWLIARARRNERDEQGRPDDNLPPDSRISDDPRGPWPPL